MQKNPDSYSQLLTRHSVRRYCLNHLDKDDLTRIIKLSETINSLNKRNIFSIQLYNFKPDSSSGKALGGFGRIMKPPYFFAPFISGEANSLVDLGFRTQQIVLDIWKRGIGSCYIGCAHRQFKVKQLLDISDQSRIISFVIFGKPDENQSLRFYQKVSQFFTRSRDRISFEELFLNNKMPSLMKKNSFFWRILEAGRQAPSATNSQPWRFEIANDRLVIFAHQKKIANIYDLQQGYAFHDTGICMANISEAAKAFGKKIKWQLINTNDKIHPINETNLPIAFFAIDDLGSM